MDLQKLVKEILQEKKVKRDRCLRIADRKFDKPSAYKSGSVVRCRQGKIWKGLKEEAPQSGESSGKPAQFKPGTKPEKIENLTLTQIIQQVEGIPYYKDVLDDVSKGDESWEVTKKVKEYAEYMKKNPSSLNNLPPIIVIDGKLQDGAHRISAIYLLQNLLDKNNNFWKNLKLKIEFWNSKSLETGDYTFIKETNDLQSGKAAPYGSGYAELKKLIQEIINEDESLYKWFKRSGPKGKEGGWVDCNAPDGKGGYKACGRKKGEKRAKYPSCRPTPSQCKQPGKGKKWGKTK